MRRKVLAAACVAVLVGPTWWLLATGDEGARVATVLAVPIAVAGLLIAIFGVPFRRTGNDVLIVEANLLRSEVMKRKVAEQQKMLADSGLPIPADVSFEQPDMVTWRSDGERRTGSLSEIEDFYSKLNIGRLVILGEAGAGKSVLANHLLIQMIKSGEIIQNVTQKIPVYLSLPAFDPGYDHTNSTGKELSERLELWMSRRLVIDYGVTAGAARRLIEECWILPILDGLDEMDGEGDSGSRAASVIRALNYPTGLGLRPVVITCRTNDYERLALLDSIPGSEPVLQDAAVIRIQPLTISQITSYLTVRFKNPYRNDEIDQRWQPVISAINRRPSGSLAKALSSPLRLFMAVTSYYDASSTPAELTKLRANQIDNHLFARLIPATISQHPLRGADHNKAFRWLAMFAIHLKYQQEDGKSGTDIELHELWSATGTLTPRIITVVIYTAIISAASAYITIYSVPDFILKTSGFDKVYYTCTLALLPLTLIAWIWLRRSSETSLRRFDVTQLRTLSGIRRIAMAAFNSIDNLRDDRKSITAMRIVAGSQGGLFIYPILSVVRGLTNRAGAVSRPRQLVRQGMVCDLGLILIPSLLFASLALLSSTFSFAAFAFIFCFVLGFPLAYVADSPWLPYLIGTHMMARQDLLPRRPAHFLDWAYDAGLMRMSGISVQFRHRELQMYLTQVIDERVRSVLSELHKSA